MRKQTLGEKHEQFVTAIKEKDYATARKLSKNSYIADRLDFREIEIEYIGFEQWQKDALWNYFHGSSEECLASIPKQKRNSVTD